MNVPPTEFIRVPAADLHRLAASALRRVGVPPDDAELIADLMVDTDLRGVFSHGTAPLPGYCRSYLSGRFNPRPEVRVVRDTPVATLVDGDGGLGHLATHRATMTAIEKAKSSGLSMAVSRNHGHFGSAGKYVRLAVREGLIGFCTSGLLARDPGDPAVSAWAHHPLDNGPMSFGFPAQEGYPVILDMCSSVVDEWDVESGRFKSIFDQMPAAVFRSFGLRAAADFLSAALGGMMLPELRQEDRPYANAYYGAFLWVVDPAAFVDAAAFKAEIDRTTRLIRALKPLPGYDRADLPGGLEWDREREYADKGIPLGERHRQSLEAIADELGVPVPWR